MCQNCGHSLFVQSFFSVFKYVICDGFRESSMCDALEKVFGNPTSAALIARSYLSTVVHSQLCERANADRSKRTGSVYVEARREKAHELFLGLDAGRVKFDTVAADSLLAGFGMFRLVSGRSKPLTLCLAAGWCAECPMRSQTCKHLMAFRMHWLSRKLRPLWSDRELDTVLPRSFLRTPFPERLRLLHADIR